MPRKDPRLGYIPDLPDHRDFMYSAPLQTLLKLPKRVDLTGKFEPVYDQGQVGSCTANAIAGAIEFDQRKQKITEFIPSRLFIYYNERSLEGTVSTDAGAMIRDGIKTTNSQGFCPETLWTYEGDPTPDNGGTNLKVATKPPANCYTEALKHKIVSYQRLIQNLSQLKGCLATGFPFVFGFTVYRSFPMQTTTGAVPMPSVSDDVLGGHAVVAVGYDDTKRVFLFRNSWGTGWGRKGYGTIPYAYLTDISLSADFWTIRTV
jgi:C1A family cysteine protease